MIYLVVDGMLSGTGIRDAANGGFLDPGSIGISDELRSRIEAWVNEYADAHYQAFDDQNQVELLDEVGTAIARAIKEEIPSSKVQYYSSALLVYLGIG